MFVYPVLVGSDENAIAKASTMRQERYLEMAARVAQKSDMTHKHGCVIVLDDDVLCTGFNVHTIHMFHSYSIHAEVDALKKLNKKKYKNLFHKMEMYVVRIGAGRFEGTLKYSKPCEGCQKAIQKYGIQRVYYSTNYDYEKRLKIFMEEENVSNSCDSSCKSCSLVLDDKSNVTL
jgi:deoxycytidylate deaminase